MCYVKVHGHEHFACFSCRKVFRPGEYPGQHPVQRKREKTCPQCGRDMAALGVCFKTPRQRNTRQWRKVELLYQHGYTYPWQGHCPGTGPGYRPRTLADTKEFLKTS